MSARKPSRTIRSLDRVADGVHFVEGPASNWTILSGDGTVSLIDAGYPRDLDLVVETLREVAGAAPLTTIAVTHGHSDHIGTINALLERWPGLEVLAAEAELPNIRREVLHQVGVPDILPHLHKRRFARWTLEGIRSGGLNDVGVADPHAVVLDEVVTLSGVRLLPQLTGGHTPGHTSYRFADLDAVATGDALVTGHPTSLRSGPQALHPMFHHDLAAATRTFVAVDDEWGELTLLPGHGPLVRR